MRRHWGLFLLFLTPLFSSLILAAGWPLIQTVRLSFTDAYLDSPQDGSFVGLENYSLLLQEPAWWMAVKNTLIFTVSSVLLECILGVLLALFLKRLNFLSVVTRVALVLPWMIPTVVSAKLWAWMFHDVFGVINRALMKLGFLSSPLPWLADASLSLATMVVVDVWKTTPFVTILVFAALQTIPKNLYWAAAIDGASPWRSFFFVTLPHIAPVLWVAVLFRSLDALRVFDLPYVLGNGTDKTATISVMARQEMIDFASLGFGSAASVLIFLLVGAIACVYVRVLKRSL